MNLNGLPTVVLCQDQISFFLFFCFFFHDFQHVRLDNHNAINFCCVLVRRLAAQQVWPQSIIVHVRACGQEGWSKKCRSWLQEERQGPHLRSCQTRWEKTKNSDIAFFCPAVEGVLRLCHSTRPVCPSQCPYPGLTPEDYVSYDKIISEQGWICVVWSWC